MFVKLAKVFGPAAKRFTLYASSEDQALVASQKLQGHRRAGQGGTDILVIPGLDSVEASNAETSWLGLRHQYYGDSKTMLHDLFYLLEGLAPQRRLLSKDPTRGFWYFRP